MVREDRARCGRDERNREARRCEEHHRISPAIVLPRDHACLAPPAPANWDPAAWPLLPSLTRRSGEEQRAARNRDGWAAAG